MKKERIILTLACMAIFFEALDVSVLNMAIPAAMAIITNTFTTPVERNRAFGIFGATAGIGFATGLAVGGLISNCLGWQWVFFINVPVISVAVLLAILYIPGDENAVVKPVNNIPSALLITGLMMLAAWLIHDLGNIAHRYTEYMLWLILFLTAGVYFVRRERVHALPLVDFRLFRLHGVVTGNIGAIMLGSIFLSYVFMLITRSNSFRSSMVLISATGLSFRHRLIRGKRSATPDL